MIDETSRVGWFPLGWGARLLGGRGGYRDGSRAQVPPDQSGAEQTDGALPMRPRRTWPTLRSLRPSSGTAFREEMIFMAEDAVIGGRPVPGNRWAS